MNTLEAIYKRRCLRCLSDISSFNLSNGEFCDKCKKELNSGITDMKYFEKFYEANEKLKEFNNFFKEKTGSELSPIQKMWAKRFFLDNSFALLAPTGIGKTTFGLLLAAFVKKSYIIFPTKLLVTQAIEKFKNWQIDVLAYTGKKSEKEKIKNGEYDILITTTQFLYKNRDLINKEFELVFVDDVDSILKSGKKIDVVLSLLGFSEEVIQKALNLINNKDYEKLQELSTLKKGNLIVSSATANPKSKRVLLFRYLLGFEVSKPNLSLRNIEDIYDENFSWELSVEYIKKLKKGGLLFLPGNETKEKLNEYIDFLSKKGIKVYSYEEFNDHIDEFKKGECYFVGFASYKNPLARGIDLPEAVRYTLFVGVPKIEFSLKEDNYKSLYFIFLTLFSFFVKKYPQKVFVLQNYINTLKKYVFLPILHPKVEEKLNAISKEIKQLIKENQEEIKHSPEISFDGEKIVTADITGYIQASGRSSRFFKGHLTKGVSLVLVDNQKAFFSLRKKLKWFSEIDFKNLKEVNLEEILLEVDKSRVEDKKIDLKTTFVVVESPTKAKTISSFFGKPSRRVINGVSVYEILLEDRVLVITASIGHDFDLVKEEGDFGVIEKYIPIFKVLEEKDKILEVLNLTSSEVEEVIIATDPDREGEKIAFDLCLNNKEVNLNIKRAEFHEITKYAFLDALKNLRKVNLDLVASQFVRRISDRWIGFKLSLYLQKVLNNSHLSAGRVQTPVLEWICKRTESLKEKVYVVRIEFDEVKIDFEFEDKQKAKKFFGKVNKVYVKKIDSKEENIFEKPFNTSELLKEAAIKLKFSPQKTMQIAQELFEIGFITYHRTDSHRVSNIGKSIAKEYIVSHFGENFVKLRSFEEGGAHECIRPTSSMSSEDLRIFAISKNLTLTNNHYKLYDLIFRKFIASQMKEVKVLKEIFEILDKKEEFITKIIEDGFNLIYPISVIFITQGEKEVKKQEFQKSKYPPYTYADIIEEMKSKGIGRPSTYAITIAKLLDRKYIIEKNNFLFATKLGFKVIEIIKNSEYYKFVEEKFTASLEEIMDKIESKEADYKEILFNLYEKVKPNQK